MDQCIYLPYVALCGKRTIPVLDVLCEETVLVLIVLCEEGEMGWMNRWIDGSMCEESCRPFRVCSIESCNVRALNAQSDYLSTSYP